MAFASLAGKPLQIFEKGSTPIVLIDEHGIIVRWNECCESTFGYTAEEAVGQNITILMQDEHKHAHDGYLKRYLDTGVCVCFLVCLSLSLSRLLYSGLAVPLASGANVPLCGSF